MDGYSIAFPNDSPFDDRILRNVNGATDFEDFVRDCLNVEAGGTLLSRRLARGADGAIDLLNEADGAT